MNEGVKTGELQVAMAASGVGKSVFQREERYIVVKRKDMTAHQEALLRSFLQGAQIPTRESVVVEPSWPFYEQVWSMIEDHVTKGNS